MTRPGTWLERKSWVLLALVSGVLILFGTMMMAAPVDPAEPISGSGCCSGESLQAVANAAPWAMDYMQETARYMGTFTVMAGVLSMVVVLVPFRRRERWAWFALLTMPALFLSHGLWLGSFPFDLVPLGVASLGLLGSVRPVFGTGTQSSETPATTSAVPA